MSFSTQLVIERLASTEPSDLVIRDAKTSLVLFRIEGHQDEYNAESRSLSIHNGRLLISPELAAGLGRSTDTGAIVGQISVEAKLYPIEITTLVNGAVQSAVLPPRNRGVGNVPDVLVPGPDVIVGDLPAMQQFGSATGGQVGLAIGTTSCNNGDVELDWFSLPEIDHPVIPQNLYRMSGGTANDDRFEQIGQSWLKHAFTALQGNVCGLGCTPAADGTHLGTGCSDPVRCEPERESKWTWVARLGESIHRRLSIDRSEPHRAYAYRRHSPNSGRSRRSEHHVEFRRDLLR